MSRHRQPITRSISTLANPTTVARIAGPAGATGATGATGAAGATPTVTTLATNLVVNSTTFGGAGGPAATITPINGKALVILTTGMENVDNGAGCLMSFVTSGTGATVLAASDTRSVASARDRTWHVSATYMVTGLANVATTFTAQYRTTANNNECDFFDRNIIVIPY